MHGYATPTSDDAVAYTVQGLAVRQISAPWHDQH